MPRVELTDGEGDAVDAAGRDDRSNPAAVREPRIEDRFRFRDIVPKTAGDVLHGDYEGFLGKGDTRGLIEVAGALDEDTLGPFTMISLMSGSRIRCSIGRQERENQFKSCHSFLCSQVMVLLIPRRLCHCS